MLLMPDLASIPAPAGETQIASFKCMVEVNP
jgi:hypothetical protein